MLIPSPNLFAEEERSSRRQKLGDPLVGLIKHVDFVPETQKCRNRRIATPRARVEHVFGALAHMGGKLVRCMGIVRTTFALSLKAATYNLKRLVYLKEAGVTAF